MLLEVKKLNAGYGFLQILRDVSLTVDNGEDPVLILYGPADAQGLAGHADAAPVEGVTQTS